MPKQAIKNVILNMVASVVPIAVLQLWILPSLAKSLPESEYGLAITLISLVTVFSQTIGNVVNNIRLLSNSNYVATGDIGDFQILLLFLSVVNAIVIALGDVYYEGGISFINIILMILFSGISLFREYYIVAFWIELDYSKVLNNNICLVLGYIAGSMLFQIWPRWQLIYLMGYTSSLIYTMCNTRLWREPLKKTIFFKKTIRDSMLLSISTILARSISYIDKLLLYPILGSHAVSVYYASSLFGKMVSLIVNPVNGVLLSYLSKMRNLRKDIFKLLIGSGIIVCTLGYVGCIMISRPILNILYPQWVDEAMAYIYATTLIAMIHAMISLVSPFVLKFCDMKWTTRINFISLIIYAAMIIAFAEWGGIWGFCVASIMADGYKLVRMIIVCAKSKQLISI